VPAFIAAEFRWKKNIMDEFYLIAAKLMETAMAALCYSHSERFY
jgi:hypothetical protein